MNVIECETLSLSISKQWINLLVMFQYYEPSVAFFQVIIIFTEEIITLITPGAVTYGSTKALKLKRM